MLEHNEALKEVSELKDEITTLKLLLAEKESKLYNYDQELERLHEIIRACNRRAFGKRSERWEGKEQIVMQFNEAEVQAQVAEEDGSEAEEKITVSGFTRARGKRKPLPDHLPREIVVVELPPDEQFSEMGEPLRIIGKQVSEKLVYEPAKIKVLQYHRLRYGLDGGDSGKLAPPVPAIIPKGIATASLLAQIVTSKYVDGLPLYRQQSIFSRIKIELSRATMARWVIQAAKACMPVWNVLEERLHSSPYVSCDETHTQVLKEKGRIAESNSWMWVRSTPSSPNKIVLFDYDPSRSGQVARRIFADYQGFLQVDGYGGYNGLEKQEGLIRIGCNMHGRRRFEEAWKTGAKDGKGLAEQGLKFYSKLYDLEKPLKESSWKERFDQRQEKVVKIWDEFKTWAEKNQSLVPPKSKIGEAFHYFLSEYKYLTGYLRDGQLEIDNGFAERAIKNFAIGRNNWLFSDSVSGAESSSLFYSFVVTARVNGVDPYWALKTLFERIPITHSIEGYEDLADLFCSKIPVL